MRPSFVGRMPTAARFYLAGVAALMLVLITAHFSIQVWSQKQAQKWVFTWEKTYGGSVGSVRLRMLRGALTLHDVHWNSPNMQVDIPFLLLRGNISASLGEVQVRDVEAYQARVMLSEQLLKQSIQQNQNWQAWIPWPSLMPSVRKVNASKLEIVVFSDVSNTIHLQRLTMRNSEFSASLKQHQWTLSGEVFSGTAILSGQNNDIQGNWSSLDAIAVARVLGFSAVDGLLSGNMRWDKESISGNITWGNERALNPVQSGKLTWRGVPHLDRWKFDIYAKGWPLQMFSEQAPIFGEHVLKSGYFQGDIEVVGDMQGWNAQFSEGHIHGLNYHLQNRSKHENVARELENIDFKQAELVWPQRQLRIKDAKIDRGIWAVDSSTSNVSRSFFSTWQINLLNVQFESLQVGDVAHGFWLPEMNGQVSLQNQKLEFHAVSVDGVADQWELHMQGGLPYGENHALDIQVRANHVPLLAFRDVLPKQLAQDTGLDGDVDLQLRGKWDVSGWRMNGDVNGQNIMWNRGSWLWRAENMWLKNVTIASDQPAKVDHWQINDWSVQSSLQPLTQIAPVDDQGHNLNSQPFWLGDWQVNTMHWKHGIFSLGYVDAVWFEADDIRVGSIRSEQKIHLNVQGRLAEGKFSLRGDWFPWGKIPWLTMKASLRNALPFAAVPWFQVSGLPVLTKGRISADMSVKNVPQAPHQYLGSMRIRLRHGGMQQGAFSNDVLTEKLGYAPNALFDRIVPNGDVNLRVPLDGVWGISPLTWGMLGHGLLDALADKAAMQTKRKPSRGTVSLSNIRLHDSTEVRKDILKHNERVRLRQVIKVLKREGNWRVELVPQLGSDVLDDRLYRRVRETQRQIEVFLSERGISVKRIFPIWPQESDRQGESTGILIQAVK